MTQKLEPTTIPTQNLVTPSSRYRKQLVLYYGEQRFITFDTYIRIPYTPKGNEKVMVITKGVEYRPDLVSYDIYGFPDNWWRILEANNMKDIWDFKVGRTIMIPDQVI